MPGSAETGPLQLREANAVAADSGEAATLAPWRAATTVVHPVDQCLASAQPEGCEGGRGGAVGDVDTDEPAGGDVGRGQQPERDVPSPLEQVAQALGLGAGEFVVEREPFAPGHEVLRDQRRPEPDLVRREVAKGEVLEPQLLGAADTVLDAGVAAVAAGRVGRCPPPGRS
jgi:hypothetical protein